MKFGRKLDIMRSKSRLRSRFPRSFRSQGVSESRECILP
jgi:hypothetical protein